MGTRGSIRFLAVAAFFAAESFWGCGSAVSEEPIVETQTAASNETTSTPNNAALFPVGVPLFSRPTACSDANPTSENQKRAIAGTEFEPLSSVRRSILDCLNEVEAAMLQYQRDLPIAELKLQKAKDERDLFNSRPSPTDEINRSNFRIEELRPRIEALEKSLTAESPSTDAESQAQADSPTQLSSEFRELRDLRSERDYLEQLIPRLKLDLDDYQVRREAIRAALADADSLKAILDQNLSKAIKEAQIARNTLDRVDDRIHQLLTNDEEDDRYKLLLSIFFACLIGGVIFLFFRIAGQDHKVRQQIFSGDAGLQFITLFALVIAIILFGIINILEGRELSALLGGISGYILGRSGSGRGQAANIGAPISPPPPGNASAERAESGDAKVVQEAEAKDLGGVQVKDKET
jgi:hypothetical protein